MPCVVSTTMESIFSEDVRLAANDWFSRWTRRICVGLGYLLLFFVRLVVGLLLFLASLIAASLGGMFIACDEHPPGSRLVWGTLLEVAYLTCGTACWTVLCGRSKLRWGRGLRRSRIVKNLGHKVDGGAV